MKSCVWTLCLTLCLSCVASLVIAGEQRVLLSFDNSGHHVKLIVSSPSPLTTQQGKRKPAKHYDNADMEAMISELPPGFALLIWKDKQGYSNLSTKEPDPRVSHAPAHIRGATESRLGQSDGAWLIVGPDSAASVMIVLQADPALGLAFEQWEVALVSP